MERRHDGMKERRGDCEMIDRDELSATALVWFMNFYALVINEVEVVEAEKL